MSAPSEDERASTAALRSAPTSDLLDETNRRGLISDEACAELKRPGGLTAESFERAQADARSKNWASIANAVPDPPVCMPWCSNGHGDGRGGWDEVHWRDGGEPWGMKRCEHTVDVAVNHEQDVDIIVERFADFDGPTVDVGAPAVRINGAFDCVSPDAAIAFAAALTEAARLAHPA